MKFKIEITYNSPAETVEQGISQVESRIKVMGFRDFKITHLQEQRSLNQNNALHKYFELVEQEAQNAGLTMDMLIKNPKEIPITRHMLKDLFRLLGKTMYGRESTAELKKDEMSKVVDTFQKIVAERLNISIPFPSMDNITL